MRLSGFTSLHTSFAWEGRCVYSLHFSVSFNLSHVCHKVAQFQHWASILLQLRVVLFRYVKSTSGWQHRHHQLPWRSGWTMSFFQRRLYGFGNNNCAIMPLIIHCAAILSHTVEHFSFSKASNLGCASKWDQWYDLSSLLMKTHNYRGFTKQDVCISFLSYLFGMTRG